MNSKKLERCEIRVLYTGSTEVVAQAEALETALGPLRADLKRTGSPRPEERFTIVPSEEGPILTVITVNGDPESIRALLEGHGFKIIPNEEPRKTPHVVYRRRFGEN